MVNRPIHLNPYEYVVVASLRAQQLMAGCIPRIDVVAGKHKATTVAQMEVSGGKVARIPLVEP